MQHLIDIVPGFQNPDVPVVASTLVPSIDAASRLLSPLVVRAGEGVYADQGTYRGYLKLDAESTNDAFILIDLRADCGNGVPPHIHRLEDETFHILEGRFQIQVGDKVWDAGPGDTLFAPRDLPHSWYCTSAEPGHLLIIVTPGANFESYLREINSVKQTPMTAMKAPQAVAAYMKMTERYGMTMLPQDIEATSERLSVTTDKHLHLGDHRGPVNVSSSITGGAFMVAHMEVDFQGGPPQHVHEREDETFYVTRGRFRALIGDTVCEAGVGDVVFAPRGIKHCWQCISEEGGHLLVLVTPGDNFETFASGLAHHNLQPPLGPSAMEAIMALSARHGMQMLPPCW